MNKSTDTILKEIKELQGIQKCNHPDSEDWQKASQSLRPRFAEMARRQK